MSENDQTTPQPADDVQGHKFAALSHEEAPPADSDDDVSGHRFVASGIRATDDDAEDDDVSGHGFAARGATDPKAFGSAEVDAPGMTGALKEKDQL